MSEKDTVQNSNQVDHLSLGLSNEQFKVKVDGDLDPACRFIFKGLMDHYKGDWSQLVKHVHVRRLVLSEKDRAGRIPFNKDRYNEPKR